MNYLQSEFNRACNLNQFEKADEIFTKARDDVIDIHYNNDELFKIACVNGNARLVEFLFNIGLVINKPFRRDLINCKETYWAHIEALLEECFKSLDDLVIAPKTQQYVDIFQQTITEKTDYNTPTYTVYSKHQTPRSHFSPKNKDTLIAIIKGYTHNTIGNFNWSNVIMAGGFIFGLLSPNSLLPSSDIDFFIYGETEKDRYNKSLYLLKHFCKPDSYCIINKSVLIIINKGMRDIQIIVTDKTNPIDITNSFDLNYTKCYCDGQTIMCSNECIYALEHRIAVIDSAKNNTDKRLYKTHSKNLWIARPKTALKSDLIDGEIINFKKLEDDIEFMSSLNKYSAVQKLFDRCSPEKLRRCIEILYDVKTVYLGLPPVKLEIKSSAFKEYTKEITSVDKWRPTPTKSNDKNINMMWTYENTSTNISQLAKAQYTYGEPYKINKNIRPINTYIKDKMVYHQMELEYVQQKFITTTGVMSVHLSPKSKWVLDCFMNNFKRIYGQDIKYNPCALAIKNARQIDHTSPTGTVTVRVTFNDFQKTPKLKLVCL